MRLLPATASQMPPRQWLMSGSIEAGFGESRYALFRRRTAKHASVDNDPGESKNIYAFQRWKNRDKYAAHDRAGRDAGRRTGRVRVRQGAIMPSGSRGGRNAMIRPRRRHASIMNMA
jgi:hypothetical protein